MLTVLFLLFLPGAYPEAPIAPGKFASTPHYSEKHCWREVPRNIRPPHSKRMSDVMRLWSVSSIGQPRTVPITISAVRVLDRQNIEVDRDFFPVTSNNDKIQRFVADIQFLMWGIGGEVDKVAGSHRHLEFEPLSPTYLSTPFHHIDSNFVTPVMMRSGLGMRLQGDCADPGLSSPTSSKVKYCCTACRGRLKHDLTKRFGSHNSYAIASPI
jgi:hypothetical protein